MQVNWQSLCGIGVVMLIAGILSLVTSVLIPTSSFGLIAFGVVMLLGGLWRRRNTPGTPEP